MSYEDFKAEVIALLERDQFFAAEELCEKYPEHDEAWGCEPIPAGTWVTL